MAKVRFDGELNSPQLDRLTNKKNYASSKQANKMFATMMFNLVHQYLAKNVYPDLANPVNGNVAVKQLPMLGFQKTKVEGTDQYTHDFIGLYTGGADKGDKNWFKFNDASIKKTLISLEGTDHIKGVGFNYPWEVNGVKNIRYSADKEALCIVTGSDKSKWTSILEVSSGTGDSEAEIEAYLEQEFKPAFDCAYYANPLLVGTTMTIEEINADIEAFKKLRRSDHRPYSYCEFWIDGEYDLYYLNLERNRYEKNGVNLYNELSAEEKARVDAATTLDEKNKVFIDFRINRFKEEAPKYWNINDGLFQLAFLLIICASDNGEKNMYPYKMKKFADGGRYQFRQDDLDSIFSTDNQGQDTKSYSVELHDFTDDTKSAYVFKGEDNAFFQALEMAFPERLQKMCKDILQAMYDLSPSGAETLDRLMGFFEEYCFGRAQEYFTKSMYNNDAEYSYEEAWNNKNYVASVDIHPLAQSLGDHYTADREFIKKRLIYLMSKYGFGGYSAYNDSSLGIISVRTQDPQGFTLTPAIDSYPAILGGQAQISKAENRVKAGESVKLAAVGGGNTNTYIVGADWLSDIGDLKDLSIDPSSVVVLSVASKRLRRLKVGDENAEEVTSYLASLSVQKCDSLESVDARNLTTLVGTVDLSQCPRLIEALFEGTNTTGVIIAAGSKVEKLHLPESVTSIDLRHTKYLEDFEYGTLGKLRFVRLENVPTINAFAMLKEAYYTNDSELKDIRLVGFNYNGNSNDIKMISNLANDKDKDGNEHTYNGIDSEGVPTQGHPVLEGSVHIDTASQSDLDFIKSVFPSLTITADQVVSYFIFADPEVSRIVAQNWGDGTGTSLAQIEAITDIGTVFNGNTVIETFDELEQFTSVTSLGIDTDSASYPKKFENCTNLKSVKIGENVKVLGRRAFKNCSSLEYINLKNVETFGYECFAGCENLYIENLELPRLKKMELYALPIKVKNVTNLGLIEILKNGFANTEILESVVLPDTLKTVSSSQFKGCLSLQTINIPDSIESIPEGFLYGTSISHFKANRITNLGGNFNNGALGNCRNLKHVDLPSTLTSIGRMALKDCTALEEILIRANTPPELVQESQFGNTNNCPIYVPDASVEAYKTATNWINYAPRIQSIFYYFGYIDFADPAVRDICVANYDTDGDGVVSIEEAAAVTDIGSLFKNNTSIESFDEFKYFENVNLTGNSFNGCKLKRITLPNITTIPYGSFMNSGLISIELPSSVTSVGSQAFQNSYNLVEVVFKGNTPPQINAFLGCNNLKVIKPHGSNESSFKTLNDNLYSYDGKILYAVPFGNDVLETDSIETIYDNAFRAYSGGTTSLNFASVTNIKRDAFNGSKIQKITLSKECSLGNYTFANSSLEELVANGINAIPYECFTNSRLTSLVLNFDYIAKLSYVASLRNTPIANGAGYIYVPDNLVEDYKAADNWSTYANQIKPLSEYVE